jgi:hypothetical protein
MLFRLAVGILATNRELLSNVFEAKRDELVAGYIGFV